MASLVEELLVGMKKEDACYTRLLELSENKRQAIIAGAVADLEEVTATEESISSDLKNLENKRASILRDMAVVLGHDGEQLTVTSVIEQLDGQPKEQGDLTAARDALVDVATRLQTANAQNSVLLQQALEMVEFDLTLFKSLKQAPETANYDKNAYNTGELLGRITDTTKCTECCCQQFSKRKYEGLCTPAGRICR